MLTVAGSPTECERCVMDAISVGYRSIDTAQVALRYLLKRDVVIIPKSTHKNRMEQNIDIFDFNLTDEEMDKILLLDMGESLFLSHFDPDTVEFLVKWAPEI